MTPELKQQWIDALRSGKYLQGKRRLRGSDTNFCCLGVLCDIVEPGEWAPFKDDAGFTHHGCLGYLPEKIQRSVRLTDSTVAHLMEMNDFGQSFGQIAAFIDECISTSPTSTPQQCSSTGETK